VERSTWVGRLCSSETSWRFKDNWPCGRPASGKSRRRLHRFPQRLPASPGRRMIVSSRLLRKMEALPSTALPIELADRMEVRTCSQFRWKDASTRGKKRPSAMPSSRPTGPSPQMRFWRAQRHHPTLGKATVYRNIQSLVDEGWLQAVEIPGDSPRYEVAGKNIITISNATNVKSCMNSKGAFPHSSRSCRADFARPGTSSFSMGSVPNAITEDWRFELIEEDSALSR
jgi:Fur family transcriptional regulator, ferric uptake regulator